jgi:hypothetical protein
MAMKFNMIVLITSCDPKRAFSTPGIAAQAAPAPTAARQQSGTSRSDGSPASLIPTHAVAKAATYNCPSAPMFSRPPRSATATARPVKTSGVAKKSVYPMPSGHEKALPSSRLYTWSGLSPTISTTIAPTANAQTTAISGNSRSRNSFNDVHPS